jgi:hypothetical protein
MCFEAIYCYGEARTKAGAERMDTREDGCLCALPMRRGVRPLSSVNIVPKKLRRVRRQPHSTHVRSLCPGLQI